MKRTTKILGVGVALAALVAGVLYVGGGTFAKASGNGQSNLSLDKTKFLTVRTQALKQKSRQTQDSPILQSVDVSAADQPKPLGPAIWYGNCTLSQQVANQFCQAPPDAPKGDVFPTYWLAPTGAFVLAGYASVTPQNGILILDVAGKTNTITLPTGYGVPTLTSFDLQQVNFVTSGGHAGHVALADGTITYSR